MFSHFYPLLAPSSSSHSYSLFVLLLYWSSFSFSTMPCFLQMQKLYMHYFCCQIALPLFLSLLNALKSFRFQKCITSQRNFLDFSSMSSLIILALVTIISVIILHLFWLLFVTCKTCPPTAPDWKFQNDRGFCS